LRSSPYSIIPHPSPFLTLLHTNNQQQGPPVSIKIHPPIVPPHPPHRPVIFPPTPVFSLPPQTPRCIRPWMTATSAEGRSGGARGRARPWTAATPAADPRGGMRPGTELLRQGAPPRHASHPTPSPARLPAGSHALAPVQIVVVRVAFGGGSHGSTAPSPAPMGPSPASLRRCAAAGEGRGRGAGAAGGRSPRGKAAPNSSALARGTPFSSSLAPTLSPLCSVGEGGAAFPPCAVGPVSSLPSSSPGQRGGKRDERAGGCADATVAGRATSREPLLSAAELRSPPAATSSSSRGRRTVRSGTSLSSTSTGPAMSISVRLAIELGWRPPPSPLFLPSGQARREVVGAAPTGPVVGLGASWRSLWIPLNLKEAGARRHFPVHSPVAAAALLTAKGHGKRMTGVLQLPGADGLILDA
jgi:hypothetical protein